MKTDDDVLVAGSVFQFTGCSEARRVSRSCSARARFKKKSKGESGGVGEERSVMEQ